MACNAQKVSTILPISPSNLKRPISDSPQQITITTAIFLCNSSCSKIVSQAALGWLPTFARTITSILSQLANMSTMNLITKSMQETIMTVRKFVPLASSVENIHEIVFTTSVLRIVASRVRISNCVKIVSKAKMQLATTSNNLTQT